MPLYKYEYSENEEKQGWQLASSRWGGPDEEKLFNRFAANENSYYVAADNYKEADQQIASPEGQQMLTSHQQLMRLIEADNQRSDVRPTDAKRQNYEELQEALDEYHRKDAPEFWQKSQGLRFQSYRNNPEELENYETLEEHDYLKLELHRQAVDFDLHHANHFAKDVRTWNMEKRGFSEEFEVAAADYEKEANRFRNGGNLRDTSWLQHYSQNQTAEQVIARENGDQSWREKYEAWANGLAPTIKDYSNPDTMAFYGRNDKTDFGFGEIYRVSNPQEEEQRHQLELEQGFGEGSYSNTTWTSREAKASLASVGIDLEQALNNVVIRTIAKSETLVGERYFEEGPGQAANVRFPEEDERRQHAAVGSDYDRWHGERGYYLNYLKEHYPIIANEYTHLNEQPLASALAERAQQQTSPTPAADTVQAQHEETINSSTTRSINNDNSFSFDRNSTPATEEGWER